MQKEKNYINPKEIIAKEMQGENGGKSNKWKKKTKDKIKIHHHVSQITSSTANNKVR